MSRDRHLRRWALLAFGTSVGGRCARTVVDFARALDCFHAGRDAEARRLFAGVAAARPTDPEPADYLARIEARAAAAQRGDTGPDAAAGRNIATRTGAQCDGQVTSVSNRWRRG
jgi:hypothetical protein